MAVAVHRPVAGHLARQLEVVPGDWRQHPGLLRLFTEQDLVWAALLALRSAVTAALVLAGTVTVTVASLFRLTGTPMCIALVAMCVRWARPILDEQ